MQEHMDYLVIGAGSGGLASAKRAASYGAKTAIVEGGRYGGTCVNVGCVPKKLLHHAALLGEGLHDAEAYGWDVHPRVNFSLRTVAEASASFITRLNDIHLKRLDESGVHHIEGFARFVDPHTVEVNDQFIHADHILIATGGKPYLPDIPGIEHVITSNEFFDLRDVPEQTLVVGAGYIAMELAGMLQSFGSQVTVLHRNDVLLRGFDSDIVEHVQSNMQGSGVQFVLNSRITSIEERQGRHYVQTEGQAVEQGFDTILFAVGRVGNVDKLNLPAAGLSADDSGMIATDEHEKTAVDHIYAVGDVNGKIALTPVAIQAGRLLADRLFNGSTQIMSYENVPSAVFTPLEIGTVGMSEERARETYGENGIKVFKAKFTPLMHSITAREVKVLMKMIVRQSDDVVVGLHLAGPDAAEIIHGFAVAVRAGLTKRDFDLTVGIHPTAGEEFVTMT
jgi:glutathione reductase (NADPH)